VSRPVSPRDYDDEVGDLDLGELTGLRTGKRSFYPAYVRSNERLERAVEALDGISHALVRGAEGPRALVEAVVRAAAEHLQARWLLLAIADGTLRAARPRFLLLTDDRLIDDVAHLSTEAREQLDVARMRPWEIATQPQVPGLVRAPMTLDGEPVGGIVARPCPALEVASTDLAVMRVLANQVAVALYSSYLSQAATQLRGRTEQLSEAAAKQARDLAARNAQLAETQQRLFAAMQRQALDDERRRIARELHDSVAQYVLSAGMTIEVCRAELATMGPEAAGIADKLTPAKDLTRCAVERLRGAIYALHHLSDEPPGPLPVMLERLSTVHLPSDLTVDVQIRGTPVPLPPEAEHSIVRITGEALFNAASHAHASRAVVRLVYARDRVVLTISDDGTGDPAQLRWRMRLSRVAAPDGRHRGLANMLARAGELGGTMTILRARAGGIMLRVAIPLPVASTGSGTDGHP
jgi:signal transduction histidine kinase